MNLEEDTRVLHYNPRKIDLVPIVGFISHVRHVRNYFDGVRQGRYELPQNAAQESLLRFGITACH